MKKRLLQNEAVVCHASDGNLALYFRFIPSSKGLPTSSEKDADNLIQTLNKQVLLILWSSLCISLTLNFQLLIDLSGPGAKREALAPALGIDLQLLGENCYLHFEPLRLHNRTFSPVIGTNLTQYVLICSGGYLSGGHYGLCGELGFRDQTH